ncbi:hypothetical protein D3C77_771830 [compost metagenome]
MMPMMPAVRNSTAGFENNWLMICWPMSWSVDTRDTTTPAAVEITSAGICATRPSPMVSSV